MNQTGGYLKINNGTLIVKGNYNIASADGTSYSSGRLYMQNEADRVVVEGNFLMYSQYGHRSYLTAGTLEVKGNFTQRSRSRSSYGSAPNNFYTTGSHKTILSGDGKQTVQFENPHSSYSHFNILEITNSSTEGVDFNSTIVVTNELVAIDTPIINQID